MLERPSSLLTTDLSPSTALEFRRFSVSSGYSRSQTLRSVALNDEVSLVESDVASASDWSCSLLPRCSFATSQLRVSCLGLSSESKLISCV